MDFNYYNTSHNLVNKYDNGKELGYIWNKADNEEFGKVITKSWAIESNTKSAHTLPQSQKRSIVADSEEEGDNSKLSELTIDNNHFLPNQSMLSLGISS